MPHSFDHNEYLIQVTDEHWIKYVVPVTIALLLYGISFLLFYLAGLSAYHQVWVSHFLLLGGILLFLITNHWFFMRILSEALDRIIITNKRLIRMQYRIILQEDILEVSFEKMKSVDSQKQGLIQNMLHYGTLSFEGNKARITLVPRPNHTAQKIQQAMNSD